MINVEACRGCGRLLLTTKVANLDVRLDSEPVDADGAVKALMGGITLWRVTQTSVGGARPEELTALRNRGTIEGPRIHPEHRCPGRPLGAPVTPSAVPSTQPTPQRPPAGQQTPFSGPSAAPSSASSAETLVSDHPKGREPLATLGAPSCDDCGRPVGAPGTYWGIQHGDRWVYAQHVEPCT